MNKELFKKSIAECIGTFILVFIACGVAAFTNGDLVATSLSFGLVIVAMAYSIGRISSCHINPAVSFAFFLLKKMNIKEFLFYVLSQIVGAILGGIAVFGIAKMANLKLVGNACNTALNYNGYIADLGFLNYFGAILVEIILTCVFVYVILCVTDKKSVAGKKGGLIIGLTLTLVHLIGINFTGTSVNPARSIGTAISAAIFNQDFDPLIMVWIFIVSPLIGSLVATLLYKFLHKEEIESTEE